MQNKSRRTQKTYEIWLKLSDKQSLEKCHPYFSIEIKNCHLLQIDNSFGQIKPFTFNAAFGEETSQEEMFQACGIKHLVEMAVEGFVSEVLKNLAEPQFLLRGIGDNVPFIYTNFKRIIIFFYCFRYSCTAFAYGQTGSGKTYTITGPLNLVTVCFLIITDNN